MDEGKQIRLASTEIAQLWTQYMNDSASICMLAYFLEKAEDAEMKPIIAHALALSQAHIQKITAILVFDHSNKATSLVKIVRPLLFQLEHVFTWSERHDRLVAIRNNLGVLAFRANSCLWRLHVKTSQIFQF